MAQVRHVVSTGRPGQGDARALKPGTVYLVGAGPGDPELLTRQGERLLREADVILHDRLVSSEILALGGSRPRRTGHGVGHLPVGRPPL